jgi:subtilisin family serine protease
MAESDPGQPNEPLRPAFTRDSTAVRLPAGAPSLADLSPEWAWAGASGEGVRVAVIDSGIDADHPGLEGCVDEAAAVEFTVDAAGEVVRTDGPHADAFGHGTACAGIIHSFAPQASITSVKVLGVGLRGKAASFLAGLQHAIESGFDVINLSLGTKKRDFALAMYELCDHAYFHDSFLVTAANNVDRPSYPSLFSSVTSVACNLSTDPWRYHNNPQPPTEFLARGIDVEVLWRQGTTIAVTGNSFAAPHISGLAALIRSKHPELRPFHLKTVLWACAANVREAGGRVPEEQAGRFSRAVRPTGFARATRATRMTGIG